MTLARMYDHVALARTPNFTRDANLKEPVSGPFLDCTRQEVERLLKLSPRSRAINAIHNSYRHVDCHLIG
jgi:hypothetical protein